MRLLTLTGLLFLGDYFVAGAPGAAKLGALNVLPHLVPRQTGASISSKSTTSSNNTTSSVIPASTLSAVLPASNGQTGFVTGTVVYTVTQLSGFESLKASTTITSVYSGSITVTSASTTITPSGLETQIAVVFAGGVAWWAAAWAGDLGAVADVMPPNVEPEDADPDDEVCKMDPKETCDNCGGSTDVGLCVSGSEIGCPCDCPNENPACTGTETIENGCPCDQVPDFEPMDINPDPSEPTIPTDDELMAAGTLVLLTIWGNDTAELPGYIAPPPPPPPPAPTGPPGNLSCLGPDAIGGNDNSEFGFLDSFARDPQASFAIEHICHTPTTYPNLNLDDVYSLIPGAANTFPGYGDKRSTNIPGDSFWFYNGAGGFEMSSNIIGTPQGVWPNDIAPQPTGSFQVPYQIHTWIRFSADQTGCPAQSQQYFMRQDPICDYIFGTILDSCDTDTTTAKNGGVFKYYSQNSGCIDYMLYATP